MGFAKLTSDDPHPDPCAPHFTPANHRACLPTVMPEPAQLRLVAMQRAGLAVFAVAERSLRRGKHR